MEEDGSLTFRSRIKRMIVTSGYNVYPVQIETVINSHPAVKTSCVIGVPDPMRGSRVKAYVILNEGHEADDAMREEIADFVKSRVSAFTRPREYEYVDSLPTTKLGKTDYRELERQSSEHGDGAM
jgi:long-chain acyl-CoA synthetase